VQAIFGGVDLCARPVREFTQLDVRSTVIDVSRYK